MTQLTNPATGVTCTLLIQRRPEGDAVRALEPKPEADTGMARSLSPCVPSN